MIEEQPRSNDIPLGLASAVLTGTAAYGYIRVFSETGPVWLSVAAALVATMLAAGLRLSRVPVALSVTVSVLSLAILASLWFAPDTQNWLIVPSGETFDVFRSMTSESAEQFRSITTPVESLDGFVIAACSAAWLLSTLTFWSAVRLQLSFETVLPSAALFGFASVVGSGYEFRSSLVYGSGILLWGLVRRWSTLRTSHTWIASDAVRGPGTAVVGASVVGAFAVLVGLLIGPRLPGYGESEIYSYRYSSPSSRSPITPYVEIGARLVEQSDSLLFTVETDSPQYWRIVALETYENNIWTTSNKFGEASGDLSGVSEPRTGFRVVEQTVTINRLGTIWAPVAYAPSHIVSTSVPLIWNPDIATLTIEGDDTVEFGAGDNYVIQSLVADYTPDQLRAASGDIPADVRTRYLVNDEVTPTMVSTAEALTSDAPTNYDKAIALQSFFQGFDYSTELGPRSGDPIDQFLTERVGFCQQFSSVFALMARSQGIPARVAIGFTWGDRVEGTENTYEVRGKHAHAWPEVWLGEYGWVAFEPTPGRGSASTTAYTGQPAAQDSADPVIDGSGTTPTTAPAAPAAQAPQDGPTLEPDVPTSETAPLAQDSWRPPTYQVVIVGLFAAYIALMFGSRWLRRQFARSRARTNSDRVLLAWTEASDAVHEGTTLAPAPSETRTEFATRVIAATDLPADPLVGLSVSATRAHYGAVELADDDARTADEQRRAIVHEVKQSSSVAERAVAILSPRSLFRRR